MLLRFLYLLRSPEKYSHWPQDQGRHSVFMLFAYQAAASGLAGVQNDIVPDPAFLQKFTNMIHHFFHIGLLTVCLAKNNRFAVGIHRNDRVNIQYPGNNASESGYPTSP